MSEDKVKNLPRKINPAQTFENIVEWVGTESKKHQAPGLIIGISGTDSLLTYLACAEAYERQEKGDRVLGLHFDHVAEAIPEAGSDKITCLKDDAAIVGMFSLKTITARQSGAEKNKDGARSVCSRR